MNNVIDNIRAAAREMVAVQCDIKKKLRENAKAGRMSLAAEFDSTKHYQRLKIRSACLAVAFLRGIPYRRAEHKTEKYNTVYWRGLHRSIAKIITEAGGSATPEEVLSWVEFKEPSHTWSEAKLYCTKCGVAPHEPGAGLPCRVKEAFDRLYIITREDLPIGLRAAQAAHSALQAGWTLQFNYSDWRTQPSTIVILQAPDGEELDRIKERLKSHEVQYTEFNDSDLEIGTTSIAFLGSDKTFFITHSLPLMR